MITLYFSFGPTTIEKRFKKDWKFLNRLNLDIFHFSSIIQLFRRILNKAHWNLFYTWIDRSSELNVFGVEELALANMNTRDLEVK